MNGRNYLLAGAVIAAAVVAGDASAVTAVSISKSADLRFGKFAAGNGGNVVVSAGGARSASGSVILSSSDSGGAAAFTVSGDAAATYAITLPSSATLTHSVDPIQTMTVGSFTSDPSATGTLSLLGSQTLTVGATLTVGSGQPSGSYSGTFAVSVNYN